jgi:hypothetical protein
VLNSSSDATTILVPGYILKFNIFSMRNAVVVVLFLILSFTASTAVAQMNLGVKAGGNFSVFGPAYGYNYKERVGYLAGITSHIQLGKSGFYLNPEVLYSRKAFTLLTPVFLDEQLRFTDVVLGLSYLELPLNIGYGSKNLMEGEQNVFMMFYAGVQPGLLQAQHLRFKPFGLNPTPAPDYTEFEHINQWNIAINLGLSIVYKRIFGDLRFSLGTTPLYTVEKDDDTVNTTQLTVGLKLF